MDLTTAYHASLIDVDNDNEPVPENIPNPVLSVNDFCYNDEWGNDKICFRRFIGAKNQKAKLLYNDWHLKMTSYNCWYSVSNSMGAKIIDSCNK